MLRGLPQLTISPTHNSSPNDLTLATSLSLTHTATRSLLASLTLAYWLGRGWSPAPHHDTPVRSERGWSHAPGGSVCRAAAGAAARSRSQPHLTLLASPRLARLASLASPRLPSTRLARLALLALASASCSTRLASLASPRLFTRSPRLLARLTSSLASPPCAPRPPRHSPPCPSPHLNLPAAAAAASTRPPAFTCLQKRPAGCEQDASCSETGG